VVCADWPGARRGPPKAEPGAAPGRSEAALMANRGGHRRFGNVRKRESGRYQIRYPGPDGQIRTGPETYDRKSDAERALMLIEVQIARGEAGHRGD
jgi:hypothetical protein